MTSLRVLYVDDEADIREVVELSLGLDPTFAVKSCASGGDALVTAAHWSPDVILLDVTMPVMDGPETLARLRQSERTAGIPIVFMTARAQTHERAQFLALGAAGVISKPFDPMKLSALVRQYAVAPQAGFAKLREDFMLRARTEGAMLAACRAALAADATSPMAVEHVKVIAHGLAENAGMAGFHRVGTEAARLEDAVEAAPAGAATSDMLSRALDCLIQEIRRIAPAS
jgi:CheY-like chemotaxis protein